MNGHVFLTSKWDEHNRKIAERPVEYGGQLSKGWATPYGFIDFAKPVSYQTAFKEAEKNLEYFEKLLKEKH